jgi:microcystin-dependent protein
MAIDFPNSPTNGQLFSSGTITWVYDGSKWNIQAANQSAFSPIGTIVNYGGTSAPTGWLLCNGTSYNRTAYPNLFGIIGTTFGPGSSPGTTFNIPDFRSNNGNFIIRSNDESVVYTTTESLLAVPVGAMQLFAMSSLPTGWLRADGSAISRTVYADLFAAIGTTYGTGDGSTTFNLPNIAGSGAGSPLYYIKAIISGIIQPSTVAHGSSHVRGGSDVLDADRDQIDFVPSRYTRDSSPAQAGAVTDLTAHLKGIDTLAGQGHIVCTSSTRPSSPATGTMIYETDTGFIVVYNGSSWVQMMAPASPPAMVLINPTSVTGGTVSNGVVSVSGTSQVFVNGVFSSAFRNYRLIFNGNGSLATVQNVRFRWRAAGVDYDNNYYNRMWYQHVGSFQTAANDNTTYAEWQYLTDLRSTWTMDIFDPNVNTYTTYISHHDSYGSTNNLVGETHSWQFAARSYDGFSMSPNGGTMSGTIRVYGIRDSI